MDPASPAIRECGGLPIRARCYRQPTDLTQTTARQFPPPPAAPCIRFRRHRLLSCWKRPRRRRSDRTFDSLRQIEGCCPGVDPALKIFGCGSMSALKLLPHR